MPGTQPVQINDSGIDGGSRDTGTADMGRLGNSGMGGDSGWFGETSAPCRF